MNIRITPGRSLSGTIILPGDKSISHRAALFSVLANEESNINNFLVSGVTEAILFSMSSLGVTWTLSGSNLRVSGPGLSNLIAPSQSINCGNSATTMRLLAGLISAAGIPAVLDGSDGLRRRPMGRIIEPLRLMGVKITATQDNYAPLVLAARPVHQSLRAIQYHMPVASAQVKSCILLAALAANGTVTLIETGITRDHTERMLTRMGVNVSRTPVQPGSDAYEVKIEPPHQRIQPLRITIPGDFSSAAFLIIAALITPGAEIILKNIGLNPTRTGLLDVLKLMEADIEILNQEFTSGEPSGDLRIRYSQLKGISIPSSMIIRMIDEFPALAVAACFASGVTEVREATELRNKESDRITVICKELSNLGGIIKELPDGFIIHGGTPLMGGAAQTYNDHRIAMALAVAGLATQEPVTISGAEIIDESFPDFKKTLLELGAMVEES